MNNRNDPFRNRSINTTNRFNDSWERDFDKKFKRAARFGVGAWLVTLVFNIVFWAVVVWGIIELVQWVTAK